MHYIFERTLDQCTVFCSCNLVLRTTFQSLQLLFVLVAMEEHGKEDCYYEHRQQKIEVKIHDFLSWVGSGLLIFLKNSPEVVFCVFCGNSCN